MNIISTLASPKVMGGQLPVLFYETLWLLAFSKGQQKSQRYYKLRLKELETWDTSNNKSNERQVKINALKQLIWIRTNC